MDVETNAMSEAEGSEVWRREVAARVERYRTRRKTRGPRYPSLFLPFDSPENWSRPAGGAATAAARATPEFDPDFDGPLEAATESAAAQMLVAVAETSLRMETGSYAEPEPPAKVIEFPRSAAIPVFQTRTLADPIFERPRIVEAPEVVPLPPALGGILIEPVQKEAGEKKVEPVLAAPSATIGRRALAALADGALVAAALAAFAAVVLRINPSLNPAVNPELLRWKGQLPVFAGTFGLVSALLWAAYKFLFVVYAGVTPGWCAAGLRLARFDGGAVARNVRRWRVLASFLSLLAAGLGYWWCLLDQDRLCWHDRITRSHVRGR